MQLPENNKKLAQPQRNYITVQTKANNEHSLISAAEEQTLTASSQEPEADLCQNT